MPRFAEDLYLFQHILSEKSNKKERLPAPEANTPLIFSLLFRLGPRAI